MTITAENKVWVLERGCYDSCHVSGIYKTAELGMKAHPEGNWEYSRYGQSGEYEEWDNGLDWDDSLRLFPQTVVTELEEDDGTGEGT